MKENIYGCEFDSDAVSSGLHRAAIGGLWEELGKKQLDFMVKEGLSPADTFLDVGCGCLRGGVHFVHYLNIGKYYGFDINQSLLDAGYDIELKAVGLQEKLPGSHLLANSDFNMLPFGRKFNYALAFSLFTHLTMNSIRRCLIEMGHVMESGGKFYATVFLCPDDMTLVKPCQQSQEITIHSDQDPYHYRLDDMIWLAGQTDFDVKLVTGFEHPRNQKMLKFIRK